jgi:hypothetical protein
MNDELRRKSLSSRAARLVWRAVAGLRRNWHDTLYLERRLLDSQRPWERDGPLRWQRELGGWRMVGSYLPDGRRPASPIA